MDIKKPDFLFKLSISVLLIISIVIILNLKIQIDRQIKDSEIVIEKEKAVQADLFRIKSINKEYFSQINILKKEIKDVTQLIEVAKTKDQDEDNIKPEGKLDKKPRTSAEAKIIASIPEQDLVMLSIGKAENVKVGSIYMIYRQGEYLGKIETIEVHPNMSAGRVLTEYKNVKGLMIERGDDATIDTEIIPKEDVIKKELKDIAERKEKPIQFQSKQNNFQDNLKEDIQYVTSSGHDSRVIHAKVIAVILDHNLLMISAGKAEGVKVGDKFTVVRAGEYLGKAVIIEIHPNMSAARIIEELNNKNGLKIERRDDAKLGVK